MPRPRILTDADRIELRRVALARRQLPSDKELARRCGVSVRAIHHVMRELLHDCVVSTKPVSPHDSHP